MLRQLTDHIVYLPADHRSDRPLLAAILGREHVLMVDAGASARHADLFTAGLREFTDRKPSWIALTHWHWDHTFGLAHLGIPAIGQRNIAHNLARLQGLAWDDAALDRRVANGDEIQFCADNLRKEYGEARDIRVALPAITFGEALHIDLGGITCVLQHLPTDHTDDAIAIHVREERVLFVGDAVAENLYANPPYYSAAQVKRLMAYVRARPADWYVESHSEPVHADGFWAVNEILDLVAHLIFEGMTAPDDLMRRARERATFPLPDDSGEVIERFLNGLRLRSS